MADSQPDMCPAHTCRGPAADCMPSLMVLTIALQMIRRTVSPIPIGRTLGSLSRAMRRQATNDDRLAGSTKDVQRRFARIASAWHKLVEWDLNDVRIMCFQGFESSPDGPAAPSI